MTLNATILQIIDFDTFTNIWYWLAVAVAWSTVSHWIIGVPYDMIHRARRHEGVAAADLDLLVAINVRRLGAIHAVASVWLTGFAGFILAGLFTMGFYYGFDLAQGMFLLAFPLTFVGVLNMRATQRYADQQPTGGALAKDLLRLRFRIQAIAVVSIFVTAMYGMFFSLSRLFIF
ncbi:hypothetical protein [Yoonia sp.]|uniref:hypothetical protein n=1 Tax=Yoonia sp. TaxID=2212373 RepID=UPI0019F4A959|nr:hypothetical protein [Yoonia sp.]MBE0413406.1 hypothetical protein [Yoonia sp.]